MLLLPLSQFLKPTKNPNPYVIGKCVSTWASAIKNASSPHKALDLYSSMHRNSIPVDSFSILFTLKSCTRLQNLTVINHLHSHVIKLGFITHVYVATSLLNAYVVTSFSNACQLFDELPERNTVTWSTMITGYSRSGNINQARAFFDEMPLRDVSCWSAMISAYINHGCSNKGLLLFREMMARGETKPDQVAIGTVLSCCVNMGSLGLLIGKSLHGFTVTNGWELNVEIGTILVDLYAKYGFLKNALQVFDFMQERNVKTWTALICGAAQHGFSQEALSLFKMMQEAGIRPNELTFTGILNACVHSGLVEEGGKYFRMIEEYGLEVKIQHYGCMVDLFGKAGLLEEAFEVIKTMKFEANIVIWGSFLSACKEHKQFDLAERTIDRVLRIIKPENGGIYTLICTLYALNGKWDDAERVRKLMLDQNVRKARGSSFIRKGL
ncbi:pentatricopeptide repeat-containing protein At5g66520-like [Jatropha curcas]|uniref:pentatricopeptide repeat-containing protein At5g66520-like n=1 Tax=Jatropha curcas TaxID=180498 RepID=UPI0005FAEE85|nr:pentatricopeptide repeat-containing protein At5g66520-like [Jatropha curcas]